MWELSASISGEILVPAWENNSALPHSFQHKHAQRVLRAKLHAGEKAMEQVFRSAAVACRLWSRG